MTVMTIRSENIKYNYDRLVIMVIMKKLPFYAGVDIPEGELDEYFCDRNQEYAEITDYLGSGGKRYIALVGKRRIGKSSLMVRCKSGLNEEVQRSILVRVEQVNPFTMSQFFYHLLREIEEGYRHSPMDKIKGAGKKLARSMKPNRVGANIGEIVTLWAAFDDELGNDKPLQELMKTTFKTIDEIGEEFGALVIMLDEFQRLFEFGTDFLWSLRGYMSNTEHASFLVSSSLVSFEDEITANEKQPFFNFFNVKEITELPEDEVRKFVAERFGKFDLTISNDAMDFMVLQSMCHPYYVQRLGLRCYELVKTQNLKSVTLNVIIQAYDDIISTGMPGHLTSEFYKVTGKMRDIVIIMARDGLERPKDIAGKLKIPENSIGGFLKKIEDRHGIIKKTERGRYVFTDAFLQEWIVRHHTLEDTRKTRIAVRDLRPFNSELVENYIRMLTESKLSLDNENRLIQSIRNEAYKIYSERMVDESHLPVVNTLVDFCCEGIEELDEKKQKEWLDILHLLSKAENILELIKDKYYDLLVRLYDGGFHESELVQILHVCGYFNDGAGEILKAIEIKDDKLFSTLVCQLDFTDPKLIKDKFNFIEELLQKLETLDPKTDNSLIEKIERLRNELENA